MSDPKDDGADGSRPEESGADPSGQDAHNPETEEDTASGGPAD
jgi:hypothetical protein